ncbi:hypothetical protein ACFQJD_19140 [Haloplanus sp. GCM10025708]
MGEYYVTCDGRRVDGPFETRAEAKRVAADRNAHDVGTHYAVTKVA